jgi:ATP-dependent Lon protease
MSIAPEVPELDPTVPGPSGDGVIELPLVRVPSPVLPGAVVTLSLGDAIIRRTVEVAVERDDARVALRAGDDDPIVVIAQVPNIGNLPDGHPAAVLRAIARARVVAVDEPSADDAVPVARVQVLADTRSTPRLEASARELRATLELIAELRRSRRLPELLRTVAEPGALADAVALWAEFGDAERLQVLHAVDVQARVDALHAWARTHLAELQVAESIRNDVSEGMDRQQREFVLRQQLASIRKELGDGDDDVADEFRERLATLDAPVAVKAALGKEIDRFATMSAQSPEHGWIRTWLDRMFELPWGRYRPDALDLDAARAQLDADHYGLDDVKDRIVEFLATRKLRHDRGLDDPAGDGDAPNADALRGREGRRGLGAIVTLVGPPGVGKTSLGQSIATAMGRSFVRIALGGVRDEAEIRGHRRTYVGSRPGRVANALAEAGSMNPVILLDEVDKLGAGAWSGDPTAALLEVLDPAQNHTFRDHYLEVDLDLSDVVFIATANVLDSIPAPLLDRMDVVRLDGYTDDEKTYIAERYLLPRQRERSGLQPDELVVGDGVIGAMISGYTREAGVRGLERELGRLVRKVTAKVATGTETPVRVDVDDLHEWLGRPTVVNDIPERTSLPGVATGLAVTGAGGDVLLIETTAFPTGPDAEPALTLTGQLGDVMKESAQIALNYVLSHAAELGIDDATMRSRFHVHVPAGAVPKDGPSAGITMTTALVSLLTDRVVDPSVGMTGEITLQGNVLPIGGVKQKVLAAHRMGLRTVVLPRRNGPDLDDVPERVREEMTFHLADTYDDVARVAFAPSP